MSQPPLSVRPFVAPGFAENAYLVWQASPGEAVVIDPGNSVAPLLRAVQEAQLNVSAILLTHAHLDHIEGVARVVEATGAPIYLHAADRFLYDAAAQQAIQFGMRVDPPPPPDHGLEHGQQLNIAGIRFDVRHVPGHSPGHVLFHVAVGGCAFVGDIVFQGSIGRTDLPGGDFTELVTGIREQVLTLPDDTVLYTGHGPHTTVGHERATNPFLMANHGGGLA